MKTTKAERERLRESHQKLKALKERRIYQGKILWDDEPAHEFNNDAYVLGGTRPR